MDATSVSNFLVVYLQTRTQMKRRFFVRSLSATTLGLCAFEWLTSCTNPTSSAVTEQSESLTFPLEEATIDQLQEKMVSGEMTSKTIVQAYLDRIKSIDQDGVKLNSVIEINPDAVLIAEQLDEERRNGKVRGPLHGIPVLIKDNIDTADKMMTTAGSIALNGNYAGKDAFIIGELRKAGAVILGKTNLSEWANFRSTRSSSGWSSRGGQTKNPYVLDRSPCGSSSGSGTAVAANLCAVAIGTETNGSIACPSSTNSVVGIKPTVGLWSRSGIIPISATQDTAGPMARTVRDAAVLLSALTAVDSRDEASAKRNASVPADYMTFLNEEGLQGKVIGVEKAFRKGHEGIDKLLDDAVDTMQKRGATVVEVELIDKLAELAAAELEFLKIEFKDGLNKYLASSKGTVRSLDDLIRFNLANEGKAMPFFKQELLVDSNTKPGIDSKEYRDLYSKLILGTRNIYENVFAEKKISALCGPANGPSWCIDLVNGDFFTGYGMYSPAAVAGYPSITVPMGFVNELPVGLSFLGLAYSEAELIAISYAYEQASKKRVAPSFTKSL
jgi:amidase